MAWVEDTQGLIKLPVPSGGGGYGLKGGGQVNLGGRLNARAEGPGEVSGLAIGLGPVSKALEAWSGVLAQEEEHKQGIELVQWSRRYQDAEREMLAQLKNMEYEQGAKESAAFAGEWYEKNNAELLGRARGDFQRKYLAEFTARSRDAGLNAAFDNQITGRKKWRAQVWEAEEGNFLNQTAQSPESLNRNLAAADQTDRFMHPDASEEYFQTQAAKRRAAHTATGIESLAAAGNFDEAVAWAERGGPVPAAEEKEVAALSPADKRKYQDLINGKRAEAAVTAQVASISQAFQGGNTEAMTAAVSAGYEAVWNDKKLPPEVKGVAIRNLTSEINVAKTRVDARDNSRLAAIVARAEAEGLTPMRMQSAILADPEMSQAGKTEQVRKIVEGTFNKPNEQNQAAAQNLMVEIDERNAGRDTQEPPRGPISNDELEARAKQYGLTTQQTETVMNYRADGGLAGQPGLAGKAREIYNQMLGQVTKKTETDLPPGSLERIVGRLQPGKSASPEELRKAVAEEALANVKGSLPNAALWGLAPKAMTYGEAATKGEKEADNFQPEVNADEYGVIDAALKAQGYQVNKFTRSMFKKAEILGRNWTPEEAETMAESRN